MTTSNAKTYSQRALDYAWEILEEKIPACIYVKQACQRFIDDLERKDLIFDIEKAERQCRFAEKMPHVKGEWAAKKEKFKLSPYQIFCTVNIYGWYVKKSGKRRFTEAYIEVPRKNGKTFWVVAFGLGGLTIEGEEGAEVYCGATSEKQAMEVFKPAKMICEKTPGLRERFGITVNAKSLTVLGNGSKFEPVIGNPGDGASVSLAIADEFHEHKNSDLVDTFRTGMGARRNPLLIYITTAGSDMGGPCYEKRDDCIKILKGAVKDDRIFCIIYTIDEGDRWDTIKAQKKANPNYGISVDPDFLKGELQQAKRSAAKQVIYKTKYLDLWVGAKAAWMNMLAFQACRKKLDFKKFKGKKCYVALDFASKLDIADLSIVFPPQDGQPWTVFNKHYLPEARIIEGGTAKSEKGNSRYKAWHADGWLTATPGNVTDFQYIKDDLEELKSYCQVLEIPYDPFQATQFSTEMTALGYPMIEYGATVANFSEPMKFIEELIIDKKIQFEKDPVLMWMFSNVVAKTDKKSNIFPDKQRPENKIDGVVALIMAIARAILKEDNTSIYEKRGIRRL